MAIKLSQLGSGSSTGSDTLVGLSDVLVSNPLNDEVLSYDVSIGKWKNKVINNEILTKTVLGSVEELRVTQGKVDEVVYVVSYYSDWESSGYPACGGGLFYWAALSEQNDDNVSVYSVEGVMTGRWLRLGIEEHIDVTWAGAKPNNSGNSLAALQDCLAYVKKANSRGRVIFFPAGAYRIEDQFLIDESGIILRGVYEKGVVSGLGSFDYAGTQIVYAGPANKSAVKFSSLDGSVGTFHSRVEKLRIAHTGVGDKPLAGLELVAGSEGTIEDVHINSNFLNGIVLDTVTIMRIRNIDLSFNEVGVRLTGNTIFGAASGCGDVWISEANIWQCSKGGIVVDSNCRFLSVKTSWIEYCKNTFLLEQLKDKNVVLDYFVVDTVSASNGFGGPEDTRFFKLKALDGATSFVKVEHAAFRETSAFCADSPYCVDIEKGLNTNFNTFVRHMEFHNSQWFGMSVAAVTSDTNVCGFWFTGQQDSQRGFFVGPEMPLTSGLLRENRMVQSSGLLDMRESLPFTLPTKAPLVQNATISAQFFYDLQKQTPTFTVGSKRFQWQPSLVDRYFTNTNSILSRDLYKLEVGETAFLEIVAVASYQTNAETNNAAIYAIKVGVVRSGEATIGLVGTPTKETFHEANESLDFDIAFSSSTGTILSQTRGLALNIMDWCVTVKVNYVVGVIR
jgi:hypothetical protein